MCDRVVALVDMDCFYCQVETRLNPSLQGKPLAVVQYNPWQGGGIIAVNYEARSFGVTRSLRGNEAKKKCPDIALVQVPEVRGKADLTRYRDAGREVVAVLCEFCDCVEKASVDEAYLDLTKTVEKRISTIKESAVSPAQLANTFVVGFTPDKTNDEEERSAGVLSWLDNVYNSEFPDKATEMLAVAGLIVEEMRAAILAKTGFQCSAGIAHNKILAKLACGIHKPNRQTILPHSSVAQLYQTLPVKKLRSLGGKFGDAIVEQLGCKVVADLLKFTESQLQQKFDEKNGSWLYNMARGFDSEPVTPRLMSKSIGCCKKFPGKQCLSRRSTVEKWLMDLSTEVSERLVKELATNQRKATTLTVAYEQNINGRKVSASRTGSLSSCEAEAIARDAMELLKKSNQTPSSDGDPKWNPPLSFLGLSAGKFIEKNSFQKSTLDNFFKAASKKTEIRLDKPLEQNLAVKSEKNEIVNKILEEEPIVTLDDLFRDAETSEKKIKGTALERESFFVRYFKNKSASSSHGISGNSNSVQKVIKNEPSSSCNTEQPNTVNTDEVVVSSSNTTKKPHGTSQIPSTSKVPEIPIPEVSEDSSDSMNFISLREIFPDLDEVDDKVIALLPSPMQKELVSRIELHKKNKNNIRSSDESDDDFEPDPKTNFKYHHGTTKETSADTSKGSSIHQEVSDDSQNSATSLHQQVKSVCDSSGPRKKPRLNSQSTSDNSENSNNSDDIRTKHTIDGKNISTADTEASSISKTSAVQDSSRSSENIEASPDIFEDAEDHSSFESEVCPHCRQVIPLLEYPEHLDYHVARDLERELNSSVPIVSKTAVQEVVGKKRGRPSSSSKNTRTSVSNKKIRSIRNFFAPIK